MVRSIGLISCTKTKRTTRCMAAEMYFASDLFAKAYAYAIGHYDEVRILSAEHGLLHPETVIDPYDATLNRMRKEERERWAKKVFHQLVGEFPDPEAQILYFHAGMKYREFLMSLLKTVGFECWVPLKEMGIGKQKKWYKEKMRNKVGS